MINQKNSHLKSQPIGQYQRKVNSRDTRISTKDPNKIVFSLKYFTDNQPKKNAQSYASWEKDKRLSKLLKTFQEICKRSVTEAITDGIIKQYDGFPPSEKTDFKCPDKFKDNKWSVINKIGGQKPRVAGIIVDNVFYIIFFDKDHRFWISSKKNT